MSLHNDNEQAKIKRLQNLYNTIPNLIWSALSLAPISVYCYQYVGLNWIFIFLVLSAVPLFFPNSFLVKIQLSKKTGLYKKLGVLVVNKVAQNGSLINRLVRKQYPGFKAVSTGKVSARKLLQQTFMYEKFHLLLFVFFNLIIIYALAQKQFAWAGLFLLTNLFYNVYPNLLQQYIRIKLMTRSQKDAGIAG